MISARLMDLVRCPDCGGRLDGAPPDLACGACHRRFAGNAAYLVLHPGVSFAEQTKYLDEALHADARREHVTPPLLSAKIRNDVLRAMLAPAPGDIIVDLGCGSGRTLVWNADRDAYQVGIDVSPYFALEACTAFLDLVKSLPPSGFERLTQRLLRESGFEQVSVTGKSGDGGIDGIGTLQVNPFVSFIVLFQCKRYQGVSLHLRCEIFAAQ